MKQYNLWIIFSVLILALAGCGSSKKIQETSPVSTFIMPGTEYVSGNGVLRAWGIGKSDSETSARKKAQMEASAELAAMLAKTVESTVEEYTTALSEGETSASKSLLRDKTKITVKKTLVGATMVYDRWAKDEQTGQYTNYIVLELKGSEYLDQLYKELEKDDTVSVDKELLQRLFLKFIDESAKK